MGDMSNDDVFLTKSTVDAKETIVPSNLQESLDTDTKNYIDEMAK